MFATTPRSMNAFAKLALCFAVCTVHAQDQHAVTNIDDTVSKVVKARDLTSGYVSIANNAFAKTSAEYTQAQKLYIAAYSDNTAWNSYVASALRGGRAKHLNSDENYQKVADKAASSASSFVQYVDDKTKPQSKAVLTILSSLADLGVKLWTNISDKIKKDRDSAATNFENATKWKSWDELVATPAPVGAKPKPGDPSPSK